MLQVKCDRQDPCKNCVANSVQCLRNRQRRTPRPKARTDDKIQALVDRLSSLEDSVLSTRPPTEGQQQDRDVSQSSSRFQHSPRESLKRKRSMDVSNEERPVPTPSSDTSQQHPVNEARSLIQKELSYNGRLSDNQRTVLETAIAFVDQISHTQSNAGRGKTLDDRVFVSTELTNDEIVHVIISAQQKEPAPGTMHFRVVDHIPPKAIERIALSLLDGAADEQTLLLYKVVVHFKAAVVFYDSHMHAPQTPAVLKHVRDRAIYHLHAALTALDGVKMMTEPSLLLLQALVAGALLMQIVGDPPACWSLIAAASRTAVALGYHDIREIRPNPTEEEEERNASLAWLIHIDRCMSMFLVRPASMPKMHVAASSLWKLDPTNPMATTFQLALEIVPVQEAWLELTLESRESSAQRSMKEEINALLTRMADIKIEKARPLYEPSPDPETALHWQVLEFHYLCTVVAVHRLSPTVAAPGEREECLRCARKALMCVKEIHRIGSEVDPLTDMYNPSLAWTILSYPLTPFFVVFCNVVGTSNARDFQLLQDVTDVILSLPKENKYGNRLYRLCVKLVELCRPLVAVENVQIPTPHAMSPDQDPTSTSVQPLECPFMDVPVMDGVMDETFAVNWSPWRDDLMWQLFQSQPSLNWLQFDASQSFTQG
ncbi:putative Zn(II)2Cys6 transcription factor-like protein [Lophiotrema nucula]|uniref:Putative Zn(II)2Cys6 transcription factor-like protein n=1 Tax=Lophiotrema nucula TaxID=690887 RepID=A0A6A5Z6T7_9PLEO|nr:putative Zn(II)2Cys6 transcription factor-like protein [Lophiotrema nucula]